MAENNEKNKNIYIIPPNFIESGTFFGGMFKVRNAIEAGVLALVTGLPVFNMNLSLTTRIIIICLISLPLAMFALIGVSGESLSSFIFIFIKYLKNRRVVGIIPDGEIKTACKRGKKKQNKRGNTSAIKIKRQKIDDFPAEFNDIDIKEEWEENRFKALINLILKKTKIEKAKSAAKFMNPVAEYIPIEKIANGIIYTKDRRYVKIIEVEPINFLLRSEREQRSIIYSFISYLKISPACAVKRI